MGREKMTILHMSSACYLEMIIEAKIKRRKESLS
jgi:hypothetical protein